MTTSLTLPRPWATNLNYSTGPDTGTATKVDPSSDANGFIKGVIAAPQHVNYLLNQLTKGQQRLVSTLLCQPRPAGLATDDNSGRTAAISLGQTDGAVACNLDSTGVQRVVDGVATRVFTGTPLTSLTSNVTGAARNSSSGRIVVIGTGGNRNCYSDDKGATWTAGGDLGGSGVDIVFNPTYGRFQATYSGHARYSTNAVAWTDVAVAGIGGTTTIQRGLALLPNGDVVVGTAKNALALSKSANGGTSWSSTGTPADTFHLGYALGGAGLDYAYLVGFRHTDRVFECYRSTDGNTWSSVATIAGATAAVPANIAPYLLQCPDTGALFVAAAHDTTGYFGIMASLDQGATWTDMVNLRGTGLPSATNASDGWGVAGGRAIFNGRDKGSGTGILLTTDGPGWS